MDWVLRDAQERDRKYFTAVLWPTHDFSKLVDKALQMIVMEHGDYTLLDPRSQCGRISIVFLISGIVN